MSVTKLSCLRKFGNIGIDLDSKHIIFIENTGLDLSSFVREALDQEMRYYDWCISNKKLMKELVSKRDEQQSIKYEIEKAVERIVTLHNKYAELDDDLSDIIYHNNKEYREEVNSWRTTNEPVNARNEGCVYHHMHLKINGEIDKKIGIYIPSELHSSIHHNSTTGKGMKEINKAALMWLCEQEVI